VVMVMVAVVRSFLLNDGSLSGAAAEGRGWWMLPLLFAVVLTLQRAGPLTPSCERRAAAIAHTCVH